MRKLFAQRWFKILFLIFAMGMGILGYGMIDGADGNVADYIIGGLLFAPFFIFSLYLRSTDEDIDEIKQGFREMSGKNDDPS